MALPPAAKSSAEPDNLTSRLPTAYMIPFGFIIVVAELVASWPRSDSWKMRDQS
ncbi:hypothetical protein [Cypionkella psychrotolerans]|uniref:hypothetical protein n=1 Tax=Cypionkella psychrotolerans TaxID=1678131 RepID=UPI000B0B358D|nr:hypothetical protein [Cypionkella psychrotolerans]